LQPLQHIATYLQHTASFCNALQRTTTQWPLPMQYISTSYDSYPLNTSARNGQTQTHCITMQQICNTTRHRMIVTGWRRLIGSPKLQIIFHKRATKYTSYLLKMTYKAKGSYESSPPCTHWIQVQGTGTLQRTKSHCNKFAIHCTNLNAAGAIRFDISKSWPM